MIPKQFFMAFCKAKCHFETTKEKVKKISTCFIACGLVQGSHSDWKTWKNGKAFSSQGILNRLEKSGKITQNTGKLKEFEINII